MDHAVFAAGELRRDGAKRGLARLGVVALALAAWAVGFAAEAPAPVTFIFTSDVHFGINRATFRGAAVVEAPVVNAAMVQAINGLPAVAMPDDGGVRAGRPVGPVDFTIITGDLTNRQERVPLKIQSATASWKQFSAVFDGGLKLTNAAGQPTPLLLVPGNHDVSNAVGHPSGLMPAKDATSLAEIYNRMLQPATPLTKDTYDFAKNKIYYSRDFGGAHGIFLSIWPDSYARKWMEADLKNVPATTPVFLFAHDPPKVDARHFSGPPVKGAKQFEGVLSETYADGDDADGPTTIEQRAFANFLKAHRNIVAYFHGHENYTEFYTWKGPDKDLALATFRSDSPMKGKFSKDETKLAFQVVTYDVAAKKLTAREVLWNAVPGKTGAAAIKWGESVTVDITPR